MFYWLFTVVVLGSILIVFYVYNYYDKRGTAKKSLERIRNKWGRPINSRRNFKLIAAYLNGRDNPDKISPAIAEDLDLNNIFNFIDRTNSKPGKQYLYKKLFTPETSFENLLKLDKKIDALRPAQARPGKCRVRAIQKLNNSDAYYLVELFFGTARTIAAPHYGFFCIFGFRG